MTLPTVTRVPKGAIERTAPPFVTGRFRLRDKWSVADFASVPVMAGNDDTAVFTTAIAEAVAADRTLYVPAGETAWSAPVTPVTGAGWRLVGEGKGITRVAHDSTGNVATRHTAEDLVSLTATLASAAAAGDTTLTVTDSSEFEKDKLYRFRDPSNNILGDGEGSVDGGSGAVPVGEPGEVIQVEQIIDSTTIKLRGQLTWSMAAGSDFRLHIDSGERCLVAGMSFFNPAVGTHPATARCLYFMRAIRPRVHDCEFIQLDTTACHFQECIAPVVTDCDFINMSDLESAANAYSIVMQKSTVHGRVSGCDSRYGRHLVTGGGQAGDIPVQDVRVHDCHSWFSRGAAFDSHPGACRWSFHDCHAYAPQQYGFQLRGPDNEVKSSTVWGGVTGVYVVYGANRARVIGNSLARCQRGIEVASSDAAVIDSNYILEPREYGIRYTRERSTWPGIYVTSHIDNTVVVGNPSGAALSYDTTSAGSWRDGYHIGSGFRAPDATVKIEGAQMKILTAAATMDKV